MQLDVIKIFDFFMRPFQSFFVDIKGMDFLCIAGQKQRIIAISCRHIDDRLFLVQQRTYVFVHECVVIHSICPAKYRVFASACRCR